jgi:hypothetical protein
LFRNVTADVGIVAEPPVQVTKTVGLFTKPVPLMVTVCPLFEPVTGFGETLVIVGAAVAGATTWKPAVFDACPSGLVTLTVQLSALVWVTSDICSCVLFRNVTADVGIVAEPPVQVTKTVGLFTKPVPLMVTVCPLFEPVTGFGETLVIVGAALSSAALQRQLPAITRIGISLVRRAIKVESDCQIPGFCGGASLNSRE